MNASNNQSQGKPSIAAQVKRARSRSVPLIAIATPDPAATIEAINGAVNGEAPKIQWDVINGLRPACKGEEQMKVALTTIAKLIGDDFDPTMGNPVELLRRLQKAPENTLVYVHLAGRWIVDPSVVQGVWLLRDAFKLDRRTLILLSPSIDLPAELKGDVVVLDEPLPDAPALEKIIREQHDAAGLKSDNALMPRAVEAVQGLPAFQAEQVVAMSLTTAGLDVVSLWDRKRRQIELTPGLKVNRDDTKFDDIGGVTVIKEFLRRVMAGQARPNAVVFIDEIEKFLAGATGGAADSSGVSQDQLGSLLAYMQDHNAAGCIFVGPPGSAKSAVAKAAGNVAGIPTIQLDLGAMKGSLVGQSEQNLRASLKTITAVSNGRSLWIATCNAISDLPPELRRRFTLGTYFFDLPSAIERKDIWRIWTAKYSLKLPKSDMPDDEGWTGAEIRQCCDIAWRLGCSLSDAAAYVVPVSRSAGEQLERLRKAAEGRFLSASKPGVYQRLAVSEPNTKGRRATTLED